jgi:TP901 family phage tail tape measure protein
VVGRAVVELVGNSAKLNSAFASAQAQGRAFVSGIDKRLQSIGTSMSRVGQTLTRGLTIPIVAAGAAATAMALSYEDAFTKISAVSNASAEDIAKWHEQIKGLAVATARDPRELAEALYFLASAGLKVNQVFPALKAAAQGAAVGLGETQDIAKLTANVLNAYPDIVGGAAGAIDTLVAAVKAGTAEPSEFAAAMGRILPIASKAKVGFDEIAASLAGLSNIGLDVNEGVTAMRGLLAAMVAPGTQAAEALKDIGITADELRGVLAEGGLLAAMQLLEERTGGNIDKLQDIIPNIRSLTGQLGLTGENAQVVADIFEQVTNNTGELSEALDETKAGPMFRMRQGLAELKVAAIELGEQLIPIARKIVAVLRDVAHWFSSLPDAMQTNIVKWGLLAAALGPVLRLLGGIVRLGGGAIGVLKRLSGALVLQGAAGGAVSAAGGAAGGAGVGLLARMLFSISRGAGAVAVAAPMGAAGIVELWNAIGPAPDTSGLKYLEGAIEANQVLGEIAPDTARKLGVLLEAFHRYGGFAQASVEFGSEKWAPQIREINRLLDEQGIHAHLTGEDIDALSEGQHVAGLRAQTLAENILQTANAYGTWHQIMQDARSATERESARVAAITQAFDNWGVAIDQVALRQAANLAKVGDMAGAIDILREALNKGTREVRDNADAWSKAERGLASSERAIMNNAAALRESGEEADEAGRRTRGYSEDVEDVPERARTEFQTPGLDEAIGDVNRLKTGLMALPAQKRIEIIIAREGSIPVMPHSGGLIMHGGGLASDEVPAVLQRGEYVINRRSAGRIGKRTLDMLNRMHGGGAVFGTMFTDTLAVSITNEPTVKIAESSISALAAAIGGGGGMGGGGVMGGAGEGGGGGGGGGGIGGVGDVWRRRARQGKILRVEGTGFGNLAWLRNMLLATRVGSGFNREVIEALRETKLGREVLEDNKITRRELNDAIRALIRANALGVATPNEGRRLFDSFREFRQWVEALRSDRLEDFFDRRERAQGKGGPLDRTIRGDIRQPWAGGTGQWQLMLPDEGEGEGGPRRRRTSNMVQNFYGDFYGFDDFSGRVAEANRRNRRARESL